MTLSPSSLEAIRNATEQRYRHKKNGKRKPGRPRKTQWPSCADCGTYGGGKGKHSYTPERYDGVRYGFDGKLCKRCYTKHYGRLRYQAMKGTA